MSYIRLDDFTWVVPEAGFRWLSSYSVDDVDQAEMRWLVPPTSGARRHGRRYLISDYPALFRTFADTPPIEEGILQFANRFGSIGRGVVKVRVPGEPQSDSIEPHPSGNYALGELQGSWAAEIGAMRNAICVWDAVRAGNRAYLERQIGVLYDEQGNFSAPDRPGPSDGGEDSDVVTVALRYLMNVANHYNGFYLAPRFVLEQEPPSLSLALKPKVLMDALWLQFILSINENKDYRRCALCDEWFEIAAGSHRKSRLYCSNACRVRAYRERQQALPQSGE